VHRNLAIISDLIAGARGLPPVVQAKAVQAFTLLAEAEASVHGVEVADIHFHEVGAVDSIIDTVGVILGLHLLGVDLERGVFCSPLPFSTGYVNTAHGILPCPAPATLHLMRGFPCIPAPPGARGELVTPTGASLLRALCEVDRCGVPPPFVIEATGLGCGRKDFAGHPNIVRVAVGRPYDGAAASRAAWNHAAALVGAGGGGGGGGGSGGGSQQLGDRSTGGTAGRSNRQQQHGGDDHHDDHGEHRLGGQRKGESVAVVTSNRDTDGGDTAPTKPTLWESIKARKQWTHRSSSGSSRDESPLSHVSEVPSPRSPRDGGSVGERKPKQQQSPRQQQHHHQPRQQQQQQPQQQQPQQHQQQQPQQQHQRPQQQQQQEQQQSGDVAPLLTEELAVVETNIDDLSPEVVAFTVEQLLAAGALDAWTVPIVVSRAYVRVRGADHCALRVWRPSQLVRAPTWRACMCVVRPLRTSA
jgi:hypothetical protein